MGWIENQVKNVANSETDAGKSRGEGSQETRMEAKWRDLVQGFRNDIDEFKQSHGYADLTQNSDAEIRVSNPSAKMAVVVTADLAGQAIRYVYQPEDDQTAVPEMGILTLRSSDNRIDLYSADERQTPEQARRLILQPLLFPDRPEELRPAV